MVNRQSASTLFAFLVVMTVPLCSSTVHAEDSCQPVFDALTKMTSTSNHSYTILTNPSMFGGKPTSTETIYFRDKAFMKLNGAWVTAPESPKETLARDEDNRRRGHAVCQFIRYDSVKGEAAALYSMHSQAEHSKEDAQFWISRISGLPLRGEFDMDIGGSDGKSHLSTRYEYSDVRPPM